MADLTPEEMEQFRMQVEGLDARVRLIRIVEAHATDSNVDGHGGVSGYCIECELKWPCPTYRWATQDGLDISCAWDLDDCAFDEHDHGMPL